MGSAAACGRSSRPASRRSAAARSRPTSSTGPSLTRCSWSCSRMPGSAPWSRGEERLRRHPRLRLRCRRVAVAVLAELQALEQRYAMPTYARAPVEFVRGEGARLWDSDGREYLDFFAGLSVHNAGHCHPTIVAAIRDQAERLGGVSNLYYTSPAMRLCERLAESSLGGKVFLCNSGTEANECAIKLVRRHAHGRGIDAPEIVVLDGAFHGRTLGALAATPRLAREDLFGPLPAGFVAVPRDDPAALRAAIGARTAGVMIEPIQGEAGIFPN